MEIVLDAKRFKGRTRAHAYLKEVLQLPDYYGKNLDALYDCLGDIAEETVIVVPEAIRKKEASTAQKPTKAEIQGPAEASDNDPFRMTAEEWETLSPVERMIYEDVKRRQQHGSVDSES